VLPCSYPPTCRDALLSPYHRWFRRRPRFHAVAWFPPATMNNLSHARRHASRSSWTQAANRPLQRASPTPKPCSLYESVRGRLGLPLTDGRYSRVSSPLKSSPTTPRSLDPPRSRGPEHSPSLPDRGLQTKARDRKDFQGPVGPLPPPRPGRTCLTPESAKNTLLADSSSCMKPARTTSRRPLLLPWPWITEQAQHS